MNVSPFDGLRPFKDHPDQFAPRDNVPWRRLAANLVAAGLPASGLSYVSSEAEAERVAAWIADHLALPAGAAILDIGCGPGLLACRLARQGHHVTGLDVAQPFVDYAQAGAEREHLACTFVSRTVHDFAPTYSFDAVMAINSIGKQITAAELDVLLAKLYTMLEAGGHVVIEFCMAASTASERRRDALETVSFHQQSPWSNQFHAWLTRELAFPDQNERVVHHIILEQDGAPEEYWSRFVLHSAPELTAAFRRYGFEIRQILGSSAGEPYDGRSQTALVWATKVTSPGLTRRGGAHADDS